jgi:UDP-N-acetylmuramate dehydrogenase
MSNHLLKDYTTLKVGGPAAYFFSVGNESEIMNAVAVATLNDLPILILGGGSNLLISDDGFKGVVIKNQISGIEVVEEEADGILVRVGAGEILDELVAYTVEKGWWGIENLTSIPGTVGATPVQNVGAYGVEVKEVIAFVEAIDMRDGSKKVFTTDECQFGYRDSFFKTSDGKNFFITHVLMRLTKNKNAKIEYADLKKVFLDNEPSQLEIRNALIKIRSQKFPDWRLVGTAGSFFKNPIIDGKHKDELLGVYSEVPYYQEGSNMFKISLGYLLDKVCGLKGYRVGNVGLSEAQALVLINYGGATADEIKNFVEEVSEKVFQKTKIKISPEVNFI